MPVKKVTLAGKQKPSGGSWSNNDFDFRLETVDEVDYIAIETDVGEIGFRYNDLMAAMTALTTG